MTQVIKYPEEIKFFNMKKSLRGYSQTVECVDLLLPKAGETIGYSRKAQVNVDSRIATIPIGYADGFSRKLGQGKFSVMIHGKMAQTIGSICMDMCMIDITAITEAREGDQVIIFQSDLEIRQMADAAETIPYEVLTSISPRVKRVYFQE
jgi:alanine racemase